MPSASSKKKKINNNNNAGQLRAAWRSWHNTYPSKPCASGSFPVGGFSLEILISIRARHQGHTWRVHQKDGFVVASQVALLSVNVAQRGICLAFRQPLTRHLVDSKNPSEKEQFLPARLSLLCS